jgi:hypothetical protein
MVGVIAYIDPGSGSLLVQLVVGGIAGAAALLRFKWGSLRLRFRRGINKNESLPSKGSKSNPEAT